MTMFELSTKARFSAAHHLQAYQGSCAQFHGHNWDVEVCVRGEEVDKGGLLVDFREMKAALATAIADLDHADLNALEAFRDINPTSENIARFLFEALSAALNNDRYHVHCVSVNETADSRATYWKS